MANSWFSILYELIKLNSGLVHYKHAMQIQPLIEVCGNGLRLREVAFQCNLPNQQKWFIAEFPLLRTVRKGNILPSHLIFFWGEGSF